ncbi:MAG: hypothetical protein NUV77_07130 [Thermoguttaceae bacterium]|nr:hypothetical protein [Thermoguttaceae bacterium]
MSSLASLVRAIHDAPARLVLALAGGGSRALAELLEVPGASRTVLEAVVPYSEPAMIDWLGGRPDQFCGEPTARAMAMAAFLRSGVLDPGGGPHAGVACTASLATDRPKRGPHRAHVAFQTDGVTAVRSLTLAKGQRTRGQEERVVADLVLNAVAEVSGLAERLPLDLVPGETVEASEIAAPQAWQDLLLGRRDAVRHGGRPATGRPAAIYPGAFHPLHAGHRHILEIAQELLGVVVEPEISILNVDKPPLDYLEIERRTAQFDCDQAVWLTRAATFDEKSRLFPGAVFVVGADTLRRIADARYYGDDPAACRAAIERIAARGCRFLVFGRSQEGCFASLDRLELPGLLRALCTGVPEERFREDISSTALRRAVDEGTEDVG